MRRKCIGLVLLSIAILLTTLYQAGKVSATASEGFSSSTVALGRFSEINVSNHFAPPNSDTGEAHDIWRSWQRTKGMSDLYVQTNTWSKGGSTGWHRHPGHSLIIVTKGTLTAYEGDDPDCKPHVYTVGMGFVDPGGEHVHIIRNETEDDAQTLAVQLIPAGQPRRIEVPDPGNCNFSTKTE